MKNLITKHSQQSDYLATLMRDKPIIRFKKNVPRQFEIDTNKYFNEFKSKKYEKEFGDSVSLI